MPTVTLNRKVFEKLTGRKLPMEKLKDRISMLGTDLEGIQGNEINVEIFPNRPDMLSEQGFARAFSSFIGAKTGLRKYAVKKSGSKVFVKDLPQEWPYAVACIVRGIKFDDEKIKEVVQLQEKLGTTLTRNRKKGGLGLYPLDKIDFPVTFKGEDPKKIAFRPLEFPGAMTATQIISRHPKGREYGHIMSGWKKYPVFVDSNGVVMSMPPIINSHDVGKIDETTRDVFIEGTGPDLDTIMISLSILAASLADMGGEIYSLEMVYPKRRFSFPDMEPRKMKIDLDYVNRLLGLELKENQMKNLLERMGHGYAKGRAFVAKYRADVLHQVDLAEDIAIAYGYENFVPEIPNISTIAEENPFEKFKGVAANVMTGLGFLEVLNYHLANQESMGGKMETTMDSIELMNSASSEYNVLRSWLMPNLMKVLGENTRYDYPQRIFEIGAVFKKSPKTDTGVEEVVRMAAATCHKEADYTEIRQCLDSLLTSLGLDYKAVKAEHGSFIPGRVARIVVGGKKVAYIGEIYPKVLENWGVGQPVSCFELNLTEIFGIVKK